MSNESTGQLPNKPNLTQYVATIDWRMKIMANYQMNLKF